MQLALLVSAERPALDEARPAPLREADVDDIEVPRHNRVGEDGTRLARNLGTEVAVGKVREREHADVRGAGKLCDLDGGRVQGLVGSLLFLRSEGRFVHEQVGGLRRFEDHPGGPGVPGQNDLPPRSRRAQDPGGVHLAPVCRLDGFARLEAAEEWPFRNPERPSGLDVEAARPLRLNQGIAVRVHTVLDFEGADAVVAPVELVTRA
jgi:hypothetical protein